MLNTMSLKYNGNRSAALDMTVTRYSHLVASCDLSIVPLEYFIVLCQILQKISTTMLVDAKSTLRAEVSAEIESNADYKIIIKKKFDEGLLTDTKSEMLEHFKIIDKENAKFEGVLSLIRRLDTMQCMGLLEKIEEVLATDDGTSLSARCKRIYKTMQGLSLSLRDSDS